MRLQLIVNGKIVMSTERGICKDNELIWYDGKSLVSVKATDADDFQITLSRISKGGELYDAHHEECAGAGRVRHGA